MSSVSSSDLAVVMGLLAITAKQSFSEELEGWVSYSHKGNTFLLQWACGQVGNAVWCCSVTEEEVFHSPTTPTAPDLPTGLLLPRSTHQFGFTAQLTILQPRWPNSGQTRAGIASQAVSCHPV